MLDEFLRPYKSRSPLIRVGRRFDGGYILNEDMIRDTDVLLSFGVNRDWTFEDDLIKKGELRKILLFDPYTPLRGSKYILETFRENLSLMKEFSVRSLLRPFYFIVNDPVKLIQFRKWLKKTKAGFEPVGVSDTTTERFVALSEIINKSKEYGSRILVKMDVEGDEYKCLFELFKNSKEIQALTGFVLEFHDCVKRKKELIEIVKSFEERGFGIFHVHGNNYTAFNAEASLCDSLEISFCNRDYLEKQKVNTRYPVEGLDYPCNRFKEDYELY